MAELSQNPDLHGEARVCTLKYRLPDSSPVSSDGEPIAAAVLRGDDLQLLIHGDWKRLVAKQDLLMIDELLDDLIQRSKESPQDVFRQLSSLNAGPIFTDSVGFLEPREGELERRFPDFLPALLNDFRKKRNEAGCGASRRKYVQSGIRDKSAD
jgi:hypothetical protein